MDHGCLMLLWWGLTGLPELCQRRLHFLAVLCYVGRLRSWIIKGR